MAIKGKDMRGSGSKANVGRKKLGKKAVTVRVKPEQIEALKEFVQQLNNQDGVGCLCSGRKSSRLNDRVAEWSRITLRRRIADSKE